MYYRFNLICLFIIYLLNFPLLSNYLLFFPCFACENQYIYDTLNPFPKHTMLKKIIPRVYKTAILYVFTKLICILNVTIIPNSKFLAQIVLQNSYLKKIFFFATFGGSRSDIKYTAHWNKGCHHLFATIIFGIVSVVISIISSKQKTKNRKKKSFFIILTQIKDFFLLYGSRVVFNFNYFKLIEYLL